MIPDTLEGWLVLVLLWIIVASVTGVVIGKGIKMADRRENGDAGPAGTTDPLSPPFD